MSDVKDQLIKLGHINPELRDHLRPILDTLHSKNASFTFHDPTTGKTYNSSFQRTDIADSIREGLKRDYPRFKFTVSVKHRPGEQEIWATLRGIPNDFPLVREDWVYDYIETYQQAPVDTSRGEWVTKNWTELQEEIKRRLPTYVNNTETKEDSDFYHLREPRVKYSVAVSYGLIKKEIKRLADIKLKSRM
jgi:hypothetical protein